MVTIGLADFGQLKKGRNFFCFGPNGRGRPPRSDEVERLNLFVTPQRK